MADEIESEVTTLKEDTKSLGEKVQVLEDENTTLRAQLASIGDMLKGVDNDLIKKVLQLTSSYSSKDENSQVKRPTKKARTGATVFIFLFTVMFSVFFSFSGSPSTVFHSIQPAFSSSNSPGITSRTLLSENSTAFLWADQDTPTLFQQYAPLFLQTWVAKMKTKHNLEENSSFTVLSDDFSSSDTISFQRRLPSSLSKDSPQTQCKEKNLTHQQRTTAAITETL